MHCCFLWFAPLFIVFVTLSLGSCVKCVTKCFKLCATKVKSVQQKAKKKMSKWLQSHLTPGGLLNRTISYLQVWHRISCSGEEKPVTVGFLVPQRRQQRNYRNIVKRWNQFFWNKTDEERKHMGTIWKKIRQVTEDKMLWFSRTRTKCLTGGGVINFSEVSFVCVLFSHYLQRITCWRDSDTQIKKPQPFAWRIKDLQQTWTWNGLFLTSPWLYPEISLTSATYTNIYVSAVIIRGPM